MVKAKKSSNATKPAVTKKTAKDTSPAAFACGDTLDISGVGELHRQLSKLLKAGRAVIMDVSQVQRADAAALQTLCAFCQTARERGVAVSWQQPSDVFDLSASLLGLNEVLGVNKLVPRCL